MSRRHAALRPARRSALLAALALAGCTATGEGSARLAITARSWVLAGEDAGVAVRASETLAERDLRLTVSVDEGLVAGDWKMSHGAATVRIPADQLAPGARRIVVKCGTERAAVVIRVVPIGRVFAVAMTIAVLAALLVARALRSGKPSAA